MFNSSEDDERFVALDGAEHSGRIAGRIVFGLVLLCGAVILANRLISRDAPRAAEIIAATWTFAFLAGSTARLLTASLVTRPAPEAHRVIGFVIPAVGIALLLPLTLHLPVALGLGVGLAGFDDWARLAVWISGPAHLCFMVLAGLRAAQLARGTRAISTRSVYVTTLIVSCVPFALFYFIPPLVVGLTGLAIVPLLDRMPRLIAAEGAAPLPTAIVAR